MTLPDPERLAQIRQRFEHRVEWIAGQEAYVTAQEASAIALDCAELARALSNWRRDVRDGLALLSTLEGIRSERDDAQRQANEWRESYRALAKEYGRG